MALISHPSHQAPLTLSTCRTKKSKKHTTLLNRPQSPHSSFSNISVNNTNTPMIKVTINEKQQIVTTCDTCNEHALIMSCMLYKFAKGNPAIMSMLSLAIAVAKDKKEVEKLFKDMPLRPHEEGMRNFLIDTTILSKDPTNPLGKPSGNKEGFKKLIEMTKPALEKLEQTPPKPRFKI